MFIVFDTEAEAQTATELCWIKYVKNKVAAGCRAVNGTEYTDLTGLTDAQICKLKLYGKDHAGIDVRDKGLTINYQLYLKAHQQNKWFSSRPPAEYLALLSGYTLKTSEEIVEEGYYPPD